MKHISKYLWAAVFTLVLFFSTTAFAISEEDAPGRLALSFYDEVTMSAYYPEEDAGHPNNHKSIPLTELVGDIIAAPTGSELMGKDILIAFEQDGETQYLLRKVDDTGCKQGRLDLLVSSEAEMLEWGLRNVEVYVIEQHPIWMN
jgi:hypothetical protein